MNKLLACGVVSCFCLAGLAVSSVKAEEKNIVPNPSFEEPGSSDDKAQGWLSGKYIRDSTTAKFGKYSVKVNKEKFCDATSDKFSIQGGKKYTLSFWHKDTESEVNFILVQYDAENKVLASPYWTGVLSKEDWKQENFTFISNPKTTGCAIVLRVYVEGASWVDMVEMKEVKCDIPIQGITYTYSIQPNEGVRDPDYTRLTDGNFGGQWGVLWSGGIIKEGLNIDFDLRTKYNISKVIIYADRFQNGIIMDTAELSADDGTGYNLIGTAPGFGKDVKEPLGEKISVVEGIEEPVPAQKVRLRLKSPVHLSLTEVEIYGTKADK